MLDFEELEEFIKAENTRLKARYNLPPQQYILAQAVKMTEEVGELSEQVLAHGALQRQEKLDARDNDALEGEVADVLITTMLLAKSMDVDVQRALERKIEKIRARKY